MKHTTKSKFNWRPIPRMPTTTRVIGSHKRNIKVLPVKDPSVIPEDGLVGVVQPNRTLSLHRVSRTKAGASLNDHAGKRRHWRFMNGVPVIILAEELHEEGN